MSITVIAPEKSLGYKPGTRIKILDVIDTQPDKVHGRLFVGVSPTSLNRILINEKRCPHISGEDWLVEEA